MPMLGGCELRRKEEAQFEDVLGLMPILDGCHWAQDGNACAHASREPMAERACLLVHHEHGSTATQTSVLHLMRGWRPPYLPISKTRADRRHLPANTAGRKMTDLAPPSDREVAAARKAGAACRPFRCAHCRAALYGKRYRAPILPADLISGLTLRLDHEPHRRDRDDRFDFGIWRRCRCCFG